MCFDRSTGQNTFCFASRKNQYRGTFSSAAVHEPGRRPESSAQIEQCCTLVVKSRQCTGGRGTRFGAIALHLLATTEANESTMTLNFCNAFPKKY